MRLSPSSLAALALCALLASSAPPAAADERPIAMTLAPLSVDAALLPDGVGFVAGYRLRADDRAFGGFSGLILKGARFEAVSDRGQYWIATARRRADGAVLGFEGAVMGSLKSARGAPLTGTWIDAEGLAETPDGLRWTAYERRHRLAASQSLKTRRVAVAGQLPTAGLARNGGLEGVAAGPDGALYVVAEEPPEGAPGDRLQGWRLAAGRAAPWSVARIDGYSATGLDFGPEGALYLLERRFDPLRGVFMRLRRFAAATVARPGFWGAGETLIALSGVSAPIDNMEALSVERAADGTLVATTLSDDNFNALQSTVLLQFRLPE